MSFIILSKKIKLLLQKVFYGHISMLVFLTEMCIQNVPIINWKLAKHVQLLYLLLIRLLKSQNRYVKGNYNMKYDCMNHL